jgi:hypothetical protein
LITRSKIRNFFIAYYETNPSWGKNWGLSWYDASGRITSGILMTALVFVIVTLLLVSIIFPTVYYRILPSTFLVLGMTGLLIPVYKWLGALLYVLLAIPFRVTFYLWNLFPEGDVDLEDENSFEESELSEDFEGDEKPKRVYNLSQYKSDDYYIDQGDDDHAAIELGTSNRQ